MISIVMRVLVALMSVYGLLTLGRIWWVFFHGSEEE